jgi:mono/diheme cytochrome c family protein
MIVKGNHMTQRFQTIALAGFILAMLGFGAATRAGAGEAKTVAATGDIAKGKQVFEANCELCHNADSAEEKVGPGLKNLYKWPAHKLSDGTEHKTHTDDIMRKQIVDGGGAMAPMGDALSSDDVTNLLAYLRTL